MAIGAVRVMAAGHAGLESLPVFVDELMAQGIPQLAPWAVDHSPDDRDRFDADTKDRLTGPWQNLEEMGGTSPSTPMDLNIGAIKTLLELVNPLANDEHQLANNPARLAAYCRTQIWPFCRSTEEMWERYKNKKGLDSSYHLAVVIPYCPEGPTSGTVGMYLGAALRQHFAQRGKSDQLVVWGIELCPPIHRTEAGDLDQTAVENAFRGYVAREELLKGVPLSDKADDENRHKPFDINIAVDGGMAKLPGASREDVWLALDRIAAQTTACLLKGVAAGDVPESNAKLKQARWNAYLVHVISERSYSPACRYLRYRVNLPWHRDPDAWEDAKLEEKRQAFLSRSDDIRPMIRDEEDPSVRKWIEDLICRADELREISLSHGFLGIGNKVTGKLKDAQEQAEAKLERAVKDDEFYYSEACKASQDTDGIIPRTDLFCINIILPEAERINAAEVARDSGQSLPIADILGPSGATRVRARISELCNDVLKREDCDPVEIASDALFDEIISISIGDWSKSYKNDSFRPTREFLRYFISEELRNVAGAFGDEKFHDLSKITQSRDDDHPAALKWTLRGVGYDVPVEYSILILARVRNGDGFTDLSTYGELRDNYEDRASVVTPERLERWQRYARYYGVRPPPELLRDNDATPPSTDASVNGHPAAHPAAIRGSA